MRGLSIVAVGACGLLLVDAEDAEACSPVELERHGVDPTHADDLTAPAPITNVTYEVYRHDGGLCGASGADCGGSGAVTIRFDASDDRAAVADLGFEVRPVAGGDDRIVFLDGAWDYVTPNEVFIAFRHEGQDLDFAVEIVAVDLNGNRSEAVRVQVRDNEPLGCSLGGARSPHGSAMLILLAGLLAIRRRGVRRGPDGTHQTYRDLSAPLCLPRCPSSRSPASPRPTPAATSP